MDIYTSNPQKIHWSKLIEHLGRNIFLFVSAAFAVLIPIVVLEESGKFAEKTEWLAKVLAISWFSSFAVWILFLVANSRVVLSIRSTFFKNHTKKKRIGFAILFLWLLLLLLFILFVRFSFYEDSALPEEIKSGIMTVTFFGGLLLLPIWGFLIGNKFVKIITAIPASLFLFFLFLHAFFIRPHKTVGASMLPSFPPQMYILSEMVSYRFRNPVRGEVIVFKRPDTNGDFYARVVGLPGEYISIRDGQVYINNEPLNEPYIAPGVKTEPGLLKEENTLIPTDKYAILGDNRNHSADSRYYGFIDKSKIIGRFFYVYWPKDKMGFIRN